MIAEDFLTFAQGLADREKSPAGFRSAISRAYYAAYLTAVPFLTKKLLIPLSGPGQHAQVRALLAGFTCDPQVAALAPQLGDLHNHRVSADYDLANTDVEEEPFARLRVREAFDIILTIQTCQRDSARLATLQADARARLGPAHRPPGA